MALNLVNPALQYPQPDQIDPSSGMTVSVPDLLKFFKSKPQAMAEANRVLQQVPAPSLVLQHPDLTGVSSNPDVPLGAPLPGGSAGPPAPSEASAPTLQFSGGGPQLNAPVANLPKFVQPKFSEVSQGPLGTPVPVNAGETKLGKLLHVVKAITEGGLAGSAYGSFGQGFQAAQQAPFENAARNLQLQGMGLQNQQQQAAMAMLPWQRAAQVVALQKAPYIEGPAGVFDVRTGKIVPGTERPEPNQTPDQQALNAKTRIDQGVGTESDKALWSSYVAMLQAKNDAKPDTSAAADLAYQDILVKKYVDQGMSKEDATKKAYEERKTLGPRTTFNLNAAATATGTEETPIDPLSGSILAQTGLSIPAFYVLTGDMSKLSRDKQTRAAAAKEAQAWANKNGVDISTLASQYKTYNDVLGQNISRLNRTKIMEQELQGTIQNLQGVVDAKDLSKLNFANVVRIWAGQQVNDPLAQQYAFHLYQLRNELAAYAAASQGRSGNEINISDQRDAETTIRNGIAQGSLEGLQQAVKNSTDKMGTVMERSVDVARKSIWDLFGVGKNYKNKSTPQGGKHPTGFHPI